MELNSPIEKEFRITERQKKALANLGLKTIRDLLFYFPSRYENFSERKNIIDLEQGDKTTVYGKISELKSERARFKKLYYTQAIISDFTGNIKAVWFRQPYLATVLKIGDKVALTGKISLGKGGLYLANPSYEKIGSYENLGEGGSFFPVYPETRGITSRWLRFSIGKIIKNLTPTSDVYGLSTSDVKDIIPQQILNKYHLPSLKSSIVFIHAPQKPSDAEAARKRFAFEEIFLIQLSRFKERYEFKNHDSFKIKITPKELDDFTAIFPFELTNAQKKSINHVIEDLQKDSPMCRLLEGDVGSGKTAVAVATTYAIVKNGWQVAYMAPTEILAQQHFQSFINYFSQLRLTTKIGLITSSECKKYPSKVRADEATHISKSQLLKWVENGEIPILIGTHALIQKNVKFKNLAFVIIDEQHRFGVSQRAILARQKSEKLPHLLSMTATPIPRTLALTIYGDLDLSLLDEIPPGRKKIITIAVPPDQRDRAYEQIRQEIKNGRQTYIICPRIEEPDPNKFLALNAKAVKVEAQRLKKEIFPELKIEILHGKLKPKEKEKILEDFRANKIQILVSTSVIEVGIDVPNATMIIIEGADRFGLAQLHQLRGRVMRSTFQPYCFVFTDSKSQKTKERIDALIKARNGFELAEYDLQLRGTGELTGAKQWGVSDIAMDALKNIKMVEAARLEAQKIIQADPELKKFPLIREKISQNSLLHFE